MRYTVIVKRIEGDGREHVYHVTRENTPTENEDEYLTFQTVKGAISWTQSEDAFMWMEEGQCSFEVMELD